MASVERILEFLPKRYRILFQLHYQQPLTYKELAEKTGISYHDVRKYVSMLRQEGMVSVSKQRGISYVYITNKGKEKVREIIKSYIIPVGIRDVMKTLAVEYIVFLAVLNVFFLYAQLYSQLSLIDVCSLTLLAGVLYSLEKLFSSKSAK